MKRAADEQEPKTVPKKAKNKKSSSPLCTAIQDGNMQAIDELLAAKVDINSPDNNGILPLWYAIEIGSLPIVQKLTTNADRSQIKKAAETRSASEAVILASACGHADIIRFFLIRRPELVDACVRANFLAKMSSLEEKVDKTFTGNTKITPLIAATYFGRTAAVAELLTYRPKLQAEAFGRPTALYLSVDKGHREIFHLLVAAGAFNESMFLSAALLRAVSKGEIGTVKVLLEANPRAITENGDNDCFVTALENGHKELALFLIERELKLPDFPRRRDKLLIWALGHKDDALTAYLRKLYEDKGKEDAVLMAGALIHSRFDVIEEVLANGRRSINDVVIITGLTDTPLRYACSVGNAPLVTFLCGKGASIDKVPPGFSTPFATAVNRGFYDIAEYLLARGADIDAHLENEPRAIDSIAKIYKDEKARDNNLEFLIAHGADVRGAQFRHPLIEKALNERRAKMIDAATQGDRGALAAMMKYHEPPVADRLIFEGALRGCQIPLLQEVLARGTIDLNERFIEWQTPLGFVSTQGDERLAPVLCESGANVATESPDRMIGAVAVTPFVSALIRERFELASFFLSKGASLDARDSSRKAPIEYAMNMNCFGAVQFLIARGASLHFLMPRLQVPGYQAPQDNRILPAIRGAVAADTTAYLNACAQGDIPLMQKHLARGVPAESSDPKKSSLTYAIESGNALAVTLLLQNGARWTLGFEGDLLDNKEIFESFVTTLSKVIAKGSAYASELLADQGFLGVLLLKSAQKGRTGCITRLLNAAVSINYADMTGLTALMAAAQEGQKECVEFLIRNNADLSLKNRGGKTAQQLAKTEEIAGMIKNAAAFKSALMDAFLNSIARNDPYAGVPDDLNIQDEQGKTLLRRAIEQKNAAAIKYLIDHGVKVDLADNKGVTPLMCAASDGNKALVESLCTAGANPELNDKEGRTSICRAARYGFREVVNYLLEHVTPGPKGLLALKALKEAILGDRQAYVKELFELWKGAPTHGEYHGPAIKLALATACATKNKQMIEIVLAFNPGQHLLLEQLQIAIDNSHYWLLAPLMQKLAPAMPKEHALAYGLKIKATIGHYTLGPQFAQPIDSIIPLNCASECWKLFSQVGIEDINEYLTNPTDWCAQFAQECLKFKGAFASKENTPARLDEWEKLYPEFKKWASLSNSNQSTVLMWACMFGHRDVVEKIVSLGLPRKFINEQDVWGRTALMYALIYGNFDCALALIYSERKDAVTGHTIYVNHCGKGVNLLDGEKKNALFYAIQASQYDEPKVLVKEDGSKEPVSALAVSLEGGSLKMFNILVSSGAKLTANKLTTALALKMIAESGNNELLRRVTSLCIYKETTTNQAICIFA